MTATQTVRARVQRPTTTPSAPRRRHRGPRAAPILQVTDLTVRTPGGPAILDEVSFSVRPGSLVAVVGPTGAGKTTLLKALTGRIAVDGGSVRIKGANAVGLDGVVRRHVGYVPQDDPLHGTLPLRRLLEYTAELRLDNVEPAERTRRIVALLDELGLREQANTPVEFLSGGQRKRASVAVELLSEPDVLILDEPTTGLDPGREKSVLSMLRNIAAAGRTVITVTHSAQALAACDVALFLAPGGHVAFFGPPAEAAKYFRHSDTADLFLDLGTRSGQEWKDRFRADPAYRRHVTADDASEVTGASATVAGAHRLGRRRQLLTLARRNVDVMWGDKRLVRLLALQGPLVGLLLWAVLPPAGLKAVTHGMHKAALGAALNHASATAMFLVLGATWLGAAAAVREIVKERHILLREKSSGLSLRSYVGSKALVIGALCVAQSVAVTIVACSRQAVPAHGGALGIGLLEIVIAVALSALAAVVLGLVLSAVVSSTDKAMTLLPLTLVGQLVLCGAWIKVTAPGLRQLGALTSAHWGVEAITATVRGDGAAWSRAIVALVGITLVGLVAVVALVERGARPARLTRVRQPVRFAPATVSLRLAGVGALAIVALAGVGARVLAGTAATHAVPEPTKSVAMARPPVVPTTVPPAPVTPAAAAPVTTVKPATPVRKATPVVAVAPTVPTTPVTVPTATPIAAAPPATTPTTAAPGVMPVASQPVSTASTPSSFNPYTYWFKYFGG